MRCPVKDTPPQFRGVGELPSELLRLLASAVELDVGTIYRSMLEQFGRDAMVAVSDALGRFTRDGVIEIDTRRLGPNDPLVGYARIASRRGAPTDGQLAAELSKGP